MRAICCPTRLLVVNAPRPWNAWVSSAVIVAAAAVFTFVIPAIPPTLVQARPTVGGETLSVGTGVVSAPSGWELDIRAATSGTPVLTRPGVTITVFDGLWFGKSKSLIDTLVERLEDQGAEVRRPEVSEDATGKFREIHSISYSGGGQDGIMLVVRDQIGVVVVRGVGEPDAFLAALDDVREIADSAASGLAEGDTPPSDPGLGAVLIAIAEGQR